MQSFNEKEKNYIEAFVNNFEILRAGNILEFGKVVEDRVGTINSIVFDSTKNKDVTDIEVLIKEIVTELDKINATPKKLTFFQRLFGKEEEISKPDYNLMLNNINLLLKELKKHIIILHKDQHLINLLGENTEEYLHELDMYLLASKLILERSYKEANELQKSDKGIEYNDYMNAINNFEKRVHDLELLRTVCIQNIPQIRLIENNNYVLIDRINYLINSTIPLWKSQIIILMSNNKANELATRNKEISEMINQILLDNATSLKGMTESTKNELKNGYVSSKSLAETTKMIISSISELEQSENKEEEKSEALVLK